MFEELIKSFMIDCQSRNLSPKTLIYYRDTLKMFHRFLVSNSVEKLEDVTSSFLKTYIVECQKTLKTGGVHARMRGVRAFFGFLERDELLEKNPFNKVKLPKINQEVQKVLMYDEFKILLSMALLGNNPVRKLIFTLPNFQLVLSIDETNCRLLW